MKVKINHMNSKVYCAFILCLLLFLNSCAHCPPVPPAKHAPMTAQLITMVEHNAELKGLLIASIEQAKRINSDRRMNPAQTLGEYYCFINWASKAMPWSILSDLPYSSLYDQIDQSLDYFYFINDQPLDELKGKGYYNNSIQYYEPYRSWLIVFTKQWGEYLSTKESWNDEYYNKAYKDERFGLQKGWYEDPSHWKSFNDFFSRYLKSPDQRPIASPGDLLVISSPADSKPQGIWQIDENSYIVSNSGGGNGVNIKSGNFKSIASLIGEESDYKNEFTNGTLTHTFLDVNDYHRYHFPVGGTVKELRIIPADDAAGGITTWDKDKNKYILSSADPGWQSIETRGCVIVDTGNFGLVALLPIGMSQVSSVKFESTVKVGRKFKKGDMLGYFLFGGSDFVILFQSKIAFSLTAPKDRDNTNTYKHLLMGEEFGRIEIVAVQ